MLRHANCIVLPHPRDKLFMEYDRIVQHTTHDVFLINLLLHVCNADISAFLICTSSELHLQGQMQLTQFVVS